MKPLAHCTLTHLCKQSPINYTIGCQWPFINRVSRQIAKYLVKTHTNPHRADINPWDIKLISSYNYASHLIHFRIESWTNFLQNIEVVVLAERVDGSSHSNQEWGTWTLVRKFLLCQAWRRRGTQSAVSVWVSTLVVLDLTDTLRTFGKFQNGRMCTAGFAASFICYRFGGYRDWLRFTDFIKSQFLLLSPLQYLWNTLLYLLILRPSPK